MAGFRVLLYYKFVEIDDPKTFAEEHLEMCRELGLHGRILVASEGLNGTVSGPVQATDEYKSRLHADPRFADMLFKEDPVETHVFQKLFVRVRPEIITLGPAEPADAVHEAGPYVSPEDFLEGIDDPNTIILDGRNKYESDLGRFKNAVCPPLMNFREFPEWLRENLADAKDKKIYTYCTGGVRCEKLTAWMIKEGFSNVFQLKDGIVTYGRDNAVLGDGWEGECYVFDERVSVPINHTPGDHIITECLHCGVKTARAQNCTNVQCNVQFVCCESCSGTFGGACSAECEGAKFHRVPGRKLGEKSILKDRPAGRRAYRLSAER
ncbi:MAG: rhodanese-related sulfurtransferase [Armatimonadetes bacterium]|nr:rhodanese-related sulfurtransferase [Armatimonadota bacterium]